MMSSRILAHPDIEIIMIEIRERKFYCEKDTRDINKVFTILENTFCGGETEIQKFFPAFLESSKSSIVNEFQQHIKKDSQEENRFWALG